MSANNDDDDYDYDETTANDDDDDDANDDYYIDDTVRNDDDVFPTMADDDYGDDDIDDDNGDDYNYGKEKGVQEEGTDDYIDASYFEDDDYASQVNDAPPPPKQPEVNVEAPPTKPPQPPPTPTNPSLESLPTNCSWECYYDDNPDLAQNDLPRIEKDVTEHYLQFGAAEGRDCTCKEKDDDEKQDTNTNDVSNDEDVQGGLNDIKEEAEELETEIKEEEQILKDKEQELEDLLDEVKEEEPEPASTVAKPVIVDPTTPTVQPTVPLTLAPTKRPTNPPIEPGTPTSEPTRNPTRSPVAKGVAPTNAPSTTFSPSSTFRPSDTFAPTNPPTTTLQPSVTFFPSDTFAPTNYSEDTIIIEPIAAVPTWSPTATHLPTSTWVPTDTFAPTNVRVDAVQPIEDDNDGDDDDDDDYYSEDMIILDNGVINNDNNDVSSSSPDVEGDAPNVTTCKDTIGVFGKTREKNQEYFVKCSDIETSDHESCQDTYTEISDTKNEFYKPVRLECPESCAIWECGYSKNPRMPVDGGDIANIVGSTGNGIANSGGLNKDGDAPVLNDIFEKGNGDDGIVPTTLDDIIKGGTTKTSSPFVVGQLKRILLMGMVTFIVMFSVCAIINYIRNRRSRRRSGSAEEFAPGNDTIFNDENTVTIDVDNDEGYHDEEFFVQYENDNDNGNINNDERSTLYRDEVSALNGLSCDDDDDIITPRISNGRETATMSLGSGANEWVSPTSSFLHDNDGFEASGTNGLGSPTLSPPDNGLGSPTLSLQDNNSNLFDNDDDGNKNDAILTSTFV